MKSSVILRKAAHLVEEGVVIGGCFAIREVALQRGCSFEDATKAQLTFETYFRRPGRIYWWKTDKRHGPRIIGLCLAAAIAESEGD